LQGAQIANLSQPGCAAVAKALLAGWLPFRVHRPSFALKLRRIIQLARYVP